MHTVPQSTLPPFPPLLHMISISIDVCGLFFKVYEYVNLCEYVMCHVRMQVWTPHMVSLYNRLGNANSNQVVRVVVMR